MSSYRVPILILFFVSVFKKYRMKSMVNTLPISLFRVRFKKSLHKITRSHMCL